jgi:hypothetical protein
MLQRIGVAMAAIALLLPKSATAQKGERSSSHSSLSTSLSTLTGNKACGCILDLQESSIRTIHK